MRDDLARFFRTIGPYLHGRAGHDETVRALWGERPPAVDAERLAIYARFCRAHRFEAVEAVHEETRAQVIARAGAAVWESLVEAYFAACPMTSAELNENGAGLAAFLGGERASSTGLPDWIAELADLEQWVWRTRIAPDDPGGAAVGPLRIASTVELRPYRHAIAAWLDEDPRAEAPERRDHLVIFWRGPDLEPRRDEADPAELVVLKLVAEGRPLDEARAVGLPDGRRDEVVDDLRRAAILLG